MNTSFNGAGPTARTAQQANETLRRSKGMDAVLMFAEEGAAFAAWHRDAAGAHEKARFRRWLEE